MYIIYDKMNVDFPRSFKNENKNAHHWSVLREQGKYYCFSDLDSFPFPWYFEDNILFKFYI